MFSGKVQLCDCSIYQEKNIWMAPCFANGGSWTRVACAESNYAIASQPLHFVVTIVKSFVGSVSGQFKLKQNFQQPCKNYFETQKNLIGGEQLRSIRFTSRLSRHSFVWSLQLFPAKKPWVPSLEEEKFISFFIEVLCVLAGTPSLLIQRHLAYCRATVRLEHRNCCIHLETECPGGPSAGTTEQILATPTCYFSLLFPFWAGK